MQKLWLHIQLHATQYMIPLILLLVLSVGGVGVAVSGISTNRIKSEALKTLVMIAKAMTKTDPLQQSNELVKLEGRRRKNGWKDTHEETPYNHRFMEEGTDKLRHWKKYRVKSPKRPVRRQRGKAIKEIYVKMELGLAAMIILLVLFGYYIGGAFMDNWLKEIMQYMTLIGRS